VGKRIGIPKEYRIEGVPEEIGRVWDQGIAWMRDAGAEIVEVSLPHTQIRASNLLHYRAGRGLVQPRPL
jgi:Asp-tRNA(Asn)/Glu-tRNA(Gln) amidotransferase A subunit family amidase